MSERRGTVAHGLALPCPPASPAASTGAFGAAKTANHSNASLPYHCAFPCRYASWAAAMWAWLTWCSWWAATTALRSRAWRSGRCWSGTR